MLRPLGALLLTTGIVSASGGDILVPNPSRPAEDGFADAIRPITNPTLFDLPLTGTNAHPIFMYQNLPGFVNTTLGPVPMGGDVQVYALQFEYAFNDRLSLVATKYGYVDIHPDTKPLWSDQSGFANLGAGLKYVFYRDVPSSTALAATATFEIPTGNHDVFQGEGDGAVNLVVSGLKLWNGWEFAGAAGARIAFDNQLASTSFTSAHVSYQVSRWFIPLVECNWYHVLDAGNGRANYFSQAGGAVPVIGTFEGGDLLNFGASNASQHRDMVTAAIGFRSRLTSSVDAGFAWEVPLTDQENGILKDRFTLDAVWHF
ncbi:MAG: transporter [Luteolibacter sp.]